MVVERLVVLLPALAAAPGWYAAARLLEARLAAPVDPATVFWTTPIALFHRVALVSYVSLLGVVLTSVVARRHPGFPLRAAHALLPASSLFLLLQTLFVP